MTFVSSRLPLAPPDASALPLAQGRPFVGNLPFILNDPLGFFLRLSRSAGPVVRVRLGMAMGELLLVTDPAVIAHVLEGNAGNYRKGRFYQRLRGVFGNNIILADGPDWRRQRHMAAPAFSARHLEAAGWVMTGSAASLVERLDGAARRGEPVDMLREFMDVALNVIIKTLFGVDVGARAEAITAAIEPLLREGERRVWWPLRPPLWVPTPVNRHLRSVLAGFDRMVYELIEERRCSGERREDILDALLHARDEAGAGLTDKQIRDEIAGFIVSGHETTGTTLAWALEALSRHPAVDTAVRKELDDVLGPRRPTTADLPQLVYTRATLYETMRLNPAVWTISRQAVADDVVQGIPIRAGTVVMMPPYVVHRTAAHWPNPEGFDPERFRNGEPRGASKFTYFPFGGGPRRCLGAHFSMMEMQIVLATLLQRFRFSLIPGSLPEAMVTLTIRPRDGLWMIPEIVQPRPA